MVTVHQISKILVALKRISNVEPVAVVRFQRASRRSRLEREMFWRATHAKVARPSSSSSFSLLGDRRKSSPSR